MKFVQLQNIGGDNDIACLYPKVGCPSLNSVPVCGSSTCCPSFLEACSEYHLVLRALHHQGYLEMDFHRYSQSCRGSAVLPVLFFSETSLDFVPGLCCLPWWHILSRLKRNEYNNVYRTDIYWNVQAALITIPEHSCEKH